MIIRGQLADYVPAVGHNLFALIDDDTGALYIKNDTMFLALRSHRLLDLKAVQMIEIGRASCRERV